MAKSTRGGKYSAVNESGFVIREGMNREQINEVSIRIANEAAEAQRIARDAYNDVARRAGSGLSVEDAIKLSNSITEDYNRKMEQLREKNRRLEKLYGISIAL